MKLKLSYCFLLLLVLISTGTEAQTIPPTAISHQIYAGEGTIADLTATGANLKWYSTETGGTELATSTALVDGATYYVSQTPGTTESARAAVTVRRISEATQKFCEEVAYADLVTTPSANTTVKWYTPGGAVVEPEWPLYETGTYYVEQVTPQTITSIGDNVGYNEGVAVDAQGNIYVSKLSSIIKINTNGSAEDFVTGLSWSKGIAAGADGTIYATDNDNVIKINSDGVITDTFTGFMTPYDVAVDAQGNIYVADTNSHSIIKMSNDGSNRHAIGSGFYNPR